MKIMVFDVPAEYGGALSILTDFFEEAKQYKEIEWVFILSTPKFKETENIKVLRFPWLKKNWGFRIYFDYFVAPKLIRKFKPDKIISLQNMIIPRTKKEQIVYLHQPLPFVSYKYSFKENRLFWIYQNIVSKKIFKSIKKAEKVIVQTKWLKSACLEKVDINESKISIVPPKINIEVKNIYQKNDISQSTFFYPSSALTYKNHNIIIEACKLLQEINVTNYKVLFTLTGNENQYISNIYNEVKAKQLPIEFIGSISREEVFKFYSQSVLIFPSYIETYGLPMLEAKMHKGPIFASNLPFSHEILGDYNKAFFFNAFEPRALADLIYNSLNNNLGSRKILKNNNREEYFKNIIDAMLR